MNNITLLFNCNNPATGDFAGQITAVEAQNRLPVYISPRK